MYKHIHIHEICINVYRNLSILCIKTILFMSKDKLNKITHNMKNLNKTKQTVATK